jgi:prevent-host-death family protein
MTPEVGVRALQQHASQVVRRVAAGEALTVTDRGRPVARLVPIAESALEQLLDDGLATAANQSPWDLADPIEQQPGDTLGEILEQARRDER